MRSPNAGQYRAETTINVMKTTMNHSPPLKPNTCFRYGTLRSPASPLGGSLAPVSGVDLDCVLGLGSNLGDRRQYLRDAVRRLREHATIVGISALYESAPVGPEQPDYLNAALRLRTRLAPRALLELQLEVERAAGRVRIERWGPRTLDIDLLYIEGHTVEEPGLTVPHRELAHRAFALLPLLDVWPEARDPHTGRRYSELLSGLDRTEVRELPDSRAGWLE